MPRNTALDRDSQPTRERLLLASLKTFGHKDYDAVGTREIVELAQANISAISYHFGGKERLYLATATFLAESIRNNLEGVLQQTRVDPNTVDPLVCRERVVELIRALARNILDGEFSADAAGFIFREQLHPTQAFDILYAELIEPMQRGYAQLLSCALGKPADDEAIKLTTHALLGQILIFRIGQTTILRRLDRAHFAAKDIDRITTLIIDNTLAAIDARLAQDH